MATPCATLSVTNPPTSGQSEPWGGPTRGGLCGAAPPLPQNTLSPKIAPLQITPPPIRALLWGRGQAVQRDEEKTPPSTTVPPPSPPHSTVPSARRCLDPLPHIPSPLPKPPPGRGVGL